MRLALALLALTALAVGCGPGAGSGPKQTKLTVTDGFGQKTLLDRTAPDARGGDTIMRLLQRNAKVTTRFGGGFVQSIDGRGGGRRGGRPVDWFFFVNGVLAEKGAASTDVHAGDRIWWDRHDWGAAAKTPAVVGSFPEPFASGLGGHRRPVRLECDTKVEAACDAVTDKLAAIGVVAGRSQVGTEQGEKNLRILVGTWPVLRADRAAELLETGPKASGVYVKIAPDGRTMEALDAQGRPVRRLGAGTGLIAATQWRDDNPTWIVTGTDPAAVRQVAQEAFDESVLHEKFALAVANGLPVRLPDTRDATP